MCAFYSKVSCSSTICHARRNSQVIRRGPSVDDQVKRLQQDDAETGNGLRRRRSSSMDRLYGLHKTPGSSRLRSASTADPDEFQVMPNIQLALSSNQCNYRLALPLCDGAL